MATRKCRTCGSLYDDSTGACSHGSSTSPRGPAGGLGPGAGSGLAGGTPPGSSRVLHGGRRPGGPGPPAAGSSHPPVPSPAGVSRPTPPPITVPPPAGGGAVAPVAVSSRLSAALFHRFEGVIETDVVERPVEGRTHWIDLLPMLSFLVFLLASLPLLIQAVMPLAVLLLALLLVPMLLFRSASGLVFGLLGMFLPRGRKAPPMSAELSFRLRTNDGRRQDVLLKGHRSGLQLGDEVDVTALRGRAPLQAMVVRNRTSQARYVRQGLVGATVASVFLAVAAASLLANWVAR